MKSRLVLIALALVGCGTSKMLTPTNIDCGTGTRLQNGLCVANATETCGPGTHDSSGSCLSDRSCGAGTTLVGNECVSLTGTTCGTGTSLMGTVCVATTVQCGVGTHLEGSTCIGATTVTCGAGTVLENAQCVASSAAVTCGAGTALQGSQCVSTFAADGGLYNVRVPTTVIDADGFSKIPVFSIGQLANGAPSTEAMVLTVSPSYAGTVGPATYDLGVLGNTSYFTPCAATSPACTGTFELHLARASAPNQIVASSGTLSLVAPTGVGSAAACAGTSNVIFFDGDTGDYIFSATDTITQGTWSANGGANYLTIHVDPSNSTQGLWWDLDFSTQQLSQPIGVNVYQQAERAPFASPGHPGIDIGGDGRGCNSITGAFQVESIVWSNSTLKDFTASFEQHCEGGTPALRGCVHFQQ